jgi:hypothetical protein
MRIASLLDHALAIAFGTMLVGAFAWSIFGPSKAVEQKDSVTPKIADRNDDLALMEAVRNVNADASILMLSPFFSLALAEPISCLLARKLKQEADLDLPVMAQLTLEQSQHCEFSRLARQYTLPVFSKIATTRELPKELFAFTAFHESTWESVGPFESFATCTKVQQEGMTKGMGTRACTKWTPRF